MSLGRRRPFVGGAVGQLALVAPDALCQGAGVVVVVVLERREDSAPCDLVGQAAIPVQGVPVAARIEPSVGQPCFFSCRVRDVCFFFFLAPAEWGWLTRQRSCSGRLGQGDSPEVKGDEGGGRLSCSPLTSCWWQNQLVPWQSSLFFVVAVVSLSSYRGARIARVTTFPSEPLAWTNYERGHCESLVFSGDTSMNTRVREGETIEGFPCHAESTRSQ